MAHCTLVEFVKIAFEYFCCSVRTASGGLGVDSILVISISTMIKEKCDEGPNKSLKITLYCQPAS